MKKHLFSLFLDFVSFISLLFLFVVFILYTTKMKFPNRAWSESDSEWSANVYVYKKKRIENNTKIAMSFTVFCRFFSFSLVL